MRLPRVRPGADATGIAVLEDVSSFTARTRFRK